MKSLLHGLQKEDLGLEDIVHLVQKGHGGDQLMEILPTDEKSAVILRNFGCPAKYLRNDDAVFMCDSVCRGFDRGMSEYLSPRFSIRKITRPDADHPYCECVYSQLIP